MNRNGKRLLTLVLAGVLAFGLVQRFELVLRLLRRAGELLSPLAAGLCFAFFFNAPLEFLEKRCFGFAVRRGNRKWLKWSRPVCLTLTYLLAAGAVFLLTALVLPQLKSSGEVLAKRLPGYLAALEAGAGQWMERLGMAPERVTALTGDWNAALEQLFSLLRKAFPDMAGSAAEMAGGVFSRLTALGIGLVFSAYLLARKEALCLSCKRTLFAFLPREKADYLVSVGKLAGRVFSRFVTGQLTEAVILGLLCFGGMGLLRMPYAALISLIIGATALVPVFGALVGAALGALLLWMVRPMTAVWFLVFLLALQQVETNFIYPRVVGSSVGLPGIWVLLAVTVGGRLFGVLGVLAGIPLASVGYALFRDAVNRRLLRRNVTREELYHAGKNTFGQ